MNPIIGIPSVIKEIRNLPPLTQQVIFTNVDFAHIVVATTQLDDQGNIKLQRLLLADRGEFLEPSSLELNFVPKPKSELPTPNSALPA